MSQKNQNFHEAVITDVEIVVECETVVETGQIIFEETDIMFELEPTASTEFADKTYQTEAELSRFLATLSEAQLAITEIVVDDGTYTVFYPLLPARVSGYHFDTDYPRPTVAALDVPELVGEFSDQARPGLQSERESDLAVLLASVRS